MCCDPEPYRDHCDGVGILVTQEDGDGVAEDEEDHQLNEGGRFRMSLFFLLDEQETGHVLNCTYSDGDYATA